MQDIHNPSVDPMLAEVLDTRNDCVRLPQTESEAREIAASLCREGFKRFPAPWVAKKLQKGRSSVYALGSPEGGSVRLFELLLCAPFGRLVIEGARSVLAPPLCGAPSRRQLAHVLADALAVLAAVEEEDLSRVSPEQIDRELRAIEEVQRRLKEAAEARQAERARQGWKAVR